MKEFLRKSCIVLLISVLSISLWEIGKKQYKYIQGQITYKKVQKEANRIGNKQEYLKQQKFDWIFVTGTSINYPLVTGTDNQYYLTHDYKGIDSIAGSIFYDAADDPYNGKLTVIFGHSMKDGTMFNNLHFFRKDISRLKTSELTLSTPEGEYNYKPLGLDIYDAKNPYYRNIDNMSSEEALAYLKNECDYFIDYEDIDEDAHIIALVTCDYTINNGRLVVFYISE